MAGDQYKITDQHAYYFLTLTVIHWIDIFSRKEYKDIVVDSLNYCIKHKGMEINAWVIMTNHIHLVGRAIKPFNMTDFLRDFKKFTSKEITNSILNLNESRRKWILDILSFEARKTGRAEKHKLWKDGNHAINLNDADIDIMEKINYIHENPVKAGYVNKPEHYIYSSAIDYCYGKGLVKVTLI